MAMTEKTSVADLIVLLLSLLLSPAWWESYPGSKCVQVRQCVSAAWSVVIRERQSRSL